MKTAFRGLLALLLLPDRSCRRRGGNRALRPSSIVIGQTGVFSGPVAEPALQYRAGAQLYFDEVNAKGGISGRKIKLVSYDDKFDPKLAAENTRKLLDEDKVFALFGYIGTGATVASIPQDQ